MPPAKSKPVAEDSRSDASTARERQIAAAAHARKSKNGTMPLTNGSALKSSALVNNEVGNAVMPGQNPGVRPICANYDTGREADDFLSIQMAWSTAPISLLNAYRVSHHLSSPAAFTSPLNQALLSNPGIGRQSPTMARRKEKRRVSKEQLALAVRKNFNSAAVSEIDVVVELVYKVRHQGQCLMRGTKCRNANF